jgi:hypothetical protein
MHDPALHWPPDPQWCPQLPQLFASLLVFVQIPLHIVPGQLHAPALQMSPGGHELKQLPQCATSLSDVHPSGHAVEGAGHVQAPDEQL